MAISDNNVAPHGDSSQKGTAKPKDKKIRPPTKVIVRRLPPDMDKKTFLNQISPIPEYDYLYLVEGDNSLGEYSFSRAYVNFVNIEDIFIFKEKFDNYVFIDQKGHEYPAVVEFAAFQKIPKKRRARPDPKCSTIESDPYYQEFLESLNEQPTQDEKPEYSYQFSTENKEEVNTTPLLEFIKQKKLDKQRIREERREERRKREVEKRKYKEEERKKYFETKHKVTPKSFSSSRPIKTFSSKVKKDINEKVTTEDAIGESDKDANAAVNTEPHQKEKEETETEEPKVFFKNNKKFYGQEKSSYYEKKDTNRYKRDDSKEYGRDKTYGGNRKYEKYDDFKNNVDYEKQYPKKIKKYSAIREERRNEIKKQEQKKLEQETVESKEKDTLKEDAGEREIKEADRSELKRSTSSKFERGNSPPPHSVSIESTSEKTDHKQIAKDISSIEQSNVRDIRDKELKTINKENDPRAQRRIRNKDRPTMAIYQPGMLSKRKQIEGSSNETPKAVVETKGSAGTGDKA